MVETQLDTSAITNSFSKVLSTGMSYIKSDSVQNMLHNVDFKKLSSYAGQAQELSRKADAIPLGMIAKLGLEEKAATLSTIVNVGGEVAGAASGDPAAMGRLGGDLFKGVLNFGAGFAKSHVQLLGTLDMMGGSSQSAKKIDEWAKELFPVAESVDGPGSPMRTPVNAAASKTVVAGKNGTQQV